VRYAYPSDIVFVFSKSRRNKELIGLTLRASKGWRVFEQPNNEVWAIIDRKDAGYSLEEDIKAYLAEHGSEPMDGM
jgi:hypothetical protein